MTRDQLPNLAPNFQHYVQQVPEMQLLAALHYSLECLNEKLAEKLTAIGDEVYAPGKWTIPVMLQHLIDTERIMSYRALTFARGDKAHLPGFEENDYAAASMSNTQTLTALLEELKVVRVSTVLMFNSFDEATLLRTGFANGKEVSVGALGFVIAGHQQHHLSIIEERYLPLAKGIISPF